MPLSHEEEERFAALERSFYASGRWQARRIRQMTDAADAGIKPDELRNRRVAVAGLVVGVILTGLFTVHVSFAVVGFMILVAAVAYLAGQAGRAAARARQRVRDLADRRRPEHTVPDADDE